MRLNWEYARYSWVHQRDSEDKDIAGHPLDRWRLLYFIHKDGEYIRKNGWDWYFLDYADKHREVFNQTVLERPTEFCTLVEKFLESLPPDTTTEWA